MSVANGSAFTFAAAGDHAATEFSAASLGVLDSTGASFYLALGDMDYDQTPTDEAWCEFVKTHLPTLGPEFPFELVAGNHEDQDGPDGYILNHAACLPDRMGSTASPTGEYGSEYYFDYPPGDPLMRVILISPALTIENEYFDYDDGTIYQEWLAGTIEDAHARDIPWVVVGMHKNCLTAGRKNCSVGRELTDMMLEKGVDLVLQGHDHNYQRSKQLALDPFECPGIVPGTFDAGCIADDGSDGRYEAGAGTVFVIGGMFGEDHYPVSPGDVEAPYFAVLDGSTFGIVRYTVSRFALEATFLPSSGSFTDTFTIVRAPPPDGTPPTASIVAPPDGSTVGGTTPIVVEAADDTGVASVELLVDGTAIGVDDAAPYSFGWDTRAVPDGIHEVAAVARDHAANATTSAAIHVTVDNTAPAVPTGLVADAGADAVQLSWDAASDPAGIARYLVSRDGVRYGTTQTNAFSDTAVQPGSTYAYAVAAVDGLGNASAPSNPVSATIPASPNTLSFGVTTDTLIRPDAPNTNFGSFPVLGVDAVPVRVSLLSFRVEGIGTRTVDRATLRLYSVNGSIEGGRVTRLLEPFSEHEVTWNTAPMHDPETIAQIGQVPLNGWIEVDLTSLVTADGEYGLRITSALGDGVGYASREHLSGRFPELVVTLVPAGQV